MRGACEMTKEEQQSVLDFLQAPYKDYKDAAKAMRIKILKETYELDTAYARRTIADIEELLIRVKKLSNTDASGAIVTKLKTAIDALDDYCVEAEREYQVELVKDFFNND